MADTRFKKGQIPWNKGLKGIHLSPITEFKKGMIPHNKKAQLRKICQCGTIFYVKPSLAPALRFDLDNGRTLCLPCHEQTPSFPRQFRREALP